ncbi:hypothetical protein K8I28_06390 [bacterium]|nr:hypothetical protein [bacterium]
MPTFDIAKELSQINAGLNKMEDNLNKLKENIKAEINEIKTDIERLSNLKGSKFELGKKVSNHRANISQLEKIEQAIVFWESMKDVSLDELEKEREIALRSLGSGMMKQIRLSLIDKQILALKTKKDIILNIENISAEELLVAFQELYKPGPFFTV